jgi:hypothetical protein
MADKTIIVIDVQGDVTYTTKDDRTAKPLKAGAVVCKDTTVKLGNDSTLSLYENHPIYLTKKGKRALKKLIDPSLTPASGTFENYFRQKLEYALGDLKDEPAPGETYGYVKTSSNEEDEDETDAWGEQALRVMNIQPCGEKVVPSFLRFEWAGMKNEQFYDLRVVDSDNDNVVLQASVKGTYLKSDLKDLNLEADKEYWWQVIPRGGTGKSEKSFFFMTKEDAAFKSLEKLNNIACFADAGPMIQSFMRAVRLERDGLLAEVYKIYNNLYLHAPENDVLKRMFTAFLWRNKLKGLARELMAKNANTVPAG